MKHKSRYGSAIAAIRGAIKGKRAVRTAEIAAVTGCPTSHIAVTLKRDGWKVRRRVWTRR